MKVSQFTSTLTPDMAKHLLSLPMPDVDMSANVLADRLRRFSDELYILENECVRLGLMDHAQVVMVPEGMINPRLVAELLWERFQQVNGRVLDAEENFQAQTESNAAARKLGAKFHQIYEGSKPIYWSLGIKRRDERYIQEIRRGIKLSEEGLDIARDWMEKRGMFFRP